MTTLASIIIPIAPYHDAVVNYALTSAYAQTIPAQVVPIRDSDRRGAGWARNAGARQATGLFLVFLDADDTIEPDFLEQTLKVWKPGTYVYTDDQQGHSVHQTPDNNVYQDGTWHAVTTLLPKAYFDFVGGFDESLPAIEDLDLYLRLMITGFCGVRCPKTLLHYSAHGLRSQMFMRRPDMEQIKDEVRRKYTMGCGGKCGGDPKPPTIPTEKQDGQILARALYQGRSERGPSGTWYARPRSQMGFRQWVYPEDIEARPDLWEKIDQPPTHVEIMEMSPDLETVERLAKEALNATP